ncbi:response regulator [Shimia thalassica]|uniref:Stalked cell differentiation-controlling protein n=1 Tax=Shimia thalassica TaxID=1715693 RepID=A0A0P1I551_9RHOB|nr:response regulator [Shimia thalassica]MBU2944364.1 response regulator [Shimia thalassica]MDO6479414.1 response regulator [Shimia thalassica]MDO6482668.1 response regulator [Shimia thalassica]MDO6502291.1 response regulator [Shimia thalassica]MDO6519987.1 response regulator [Shimia thalassica]
MKILAVDDDENIRDLLEASMAAETKHVLTTASSGPSALKIVSEESTPFDCFLLDIQMPVMNGITLCEKLRRTKGHARVPIIMLTAMSQKKYIDRAFKAGATDYVTKPFDFLELFSRISNAERLSKEQVLSKEGRSEVATLKRDLERSFAHSLSEPVEIGGVEGVVGYVTFENYIMQLSRTKLMRSHVFAVKIVNVEKVHRSLSHIAFHQLLTDIATTLSVTMSQSENLITYRGNGVFLCTTNAKSDHSQHSFEMMLNGQMAETVAARFNNERVNLSVGEAVSLMSLTRAGALFSLQTAATSAENRATDRKEVLQKMQRLVRTRKRSGLQNDMERRAYEVLLRDAMKDEPKKGLFGLSGVGLRLR